VRSLARYATANARMRALLPELLGAADYGPLLRAATVDDAWAALRKTVYGEWLPDGPCGGVLVTERRLGEVTAARFARVVQMLRGRPETVGRLLLSRWELDALEGALRLWHGQDVGLRDLEAYPAELCGVALSSVLAAPELHDVAVLFADTPYAEPMLAAAATYRDTGSLAYVEIALERDYYVRLLRAVQALGGEDARQGLAIVSAEIDLINLAWIGRLQHYHDIGGAQLRGLIIPGSSALSQELARGGLTEEGMHNWTARLLRDQSLPAGATTPAPERFELLEHLAAEQAVSRARRMLAGYPFSIAGVFAFYGLKRVELRNLCAIFAGKAAGLAEAEIARHLHGVE